MRSFEWNRFNFNRDDPTRYMYQAPYMAPCGTGVLVFYDSRHRPEKDQFEEHLDSCEKCKKVLEDFGGTYDEWLEDGTGMSRIQDEIHEKVMEELRKGDEIEKCVESSERSGTT